MKLFLPVALCFLSLADSSDRKNDKRRLLLQKSRHGRYRLDETRLIVNLCGSDEMPRGWRTAADLKAIRKKASSTGTPLPSLEGLADLQCSVSGQHCLDKRGRNLVRFFRDLVRRGTVDQVIVLDARLEAHGFLDDQAVSWHQRLNNWERIGMPLHQLNADEESKLAVLRKAINPRTGYGEVVVCDKPSPEFGPFSGDRVIRYRSVHSERELWEHIPHVRYFRLHQPDHCPPPDSQVDEFMRLIDAKGNRNTWFHLHCKGGAGRSTAIAAFIDMIFNADRVSFNDILTRQYLLGHSNLLAQHAAADNPAKDKCYRDRVDFLRRFHQFCKLRLQHRSLLPWTKYVAVGGGEKAFYGNTTNI